MKMDPGFEKANEIYFRLGIIYKQQQKFDLSLQVKILFSAKKKKKLGAARKRENSPSS